MLLVALLCTIDKKIFEGACEGVHFFLIGAPAQLVIVLVADCPDGYGK